MTQRLLLAHDNVIDECTLSGGAYVDTLPLSYAQTRQIDKTARACGADKRNTWFYAAAPSAVTVAAMALLGSNLSTAGEVRWRGFSVDPRGVADGVFTGDELPDGWTFTRTGTAWYFGEDGLLYSAGTNTPRFEWIGGVRMGMLLEAGRTNQLTWSRDVSNAAWAKTTLTVSQTVTGLDGVANSAGRLTAGGANSQAIQTIGAAGGLAVVFSCYARRATGAGDVRLSVDNFATSTVIALTADWQRFQIAGTMDGSGRCGIRVTTNGDAIEVDCFQLEIVAAGASASSPIITTTVAVGRSAESLTYTLTGAAFSGGAMLLTAGLISRPTSTVDLAVATNGGTSAAGFTMTSAGVPTGTYRNASAEQLAGITGSAISAGSEMTAAVSWASNDARASFAAAAVVSDTTVSVPAVSMTTLQCAPQSNASLYLRRLKLYPATRTNAQLQALSGTEQEVAADFDSGLVDAWPAAYISATTSRMRAGAVTPALYLPAAAQTYTYWRVDMVDEANADGFVEFGRPMLMWNAIQIEADVALGTGVDFVPRATTVRADSGSRYFEERPEPRIWDFTFHKLTDAEAWDSIYELMRQRGSTGEVLFSLDPTDTRNLPRHTFACTLESLAKLAAVARGWWTKAYRAEELL